MTGSVVSWSATEIAHGVRAGTLRAADVTAACLERIAAHDAGIGAFLEVFTDPALAAAADVDARRARGESLGALAGVPIAIKDNLALRGARLTCGSRILGDFVSPYTASAVQRALDAGAVIVGRTNMDEFGMGSSTERSAFGPTRNPYARDRVPGGSSGGAAAAVAARFVPVAIGSDTGGSIRQPASFCGVSGFKPTYGRISRFGLVAYASSLDTVGTLARSARDHATLLGVMAGHDPRDATSLREPLVQAAGPLPRETAQGLRLGVPKQVFGAGLQPAVESAVRATLARLVAAGATLIDIDLPHADYAIPTYYLIATAEASSNLARFDGVRYGRREPARELDAMYRRTRTAGFGEEVKARILLGTFALERGYYDAYYLKATKVRALIRADLLAALAQCDALAMPTTPTVAFPLGSKLEDPLAMYLADVLTVSANLAGLPAISVPCGRDDDGLPIGVQFVAAPRREDAALACASILEGLEGPHHLAPPLP